MLHEMYYLREEEVLHSLHYLNVIISVSARESKLQHE